MSVTNTVVLTTSAGVAPLRQRRSALARAWASWAAARHSTRRGVRRLVAARRRADRRSPTTGRPDDGGIGTEGELGTAAELSARGHRLHRSPVVHRRGPRAVDRPRPGEGRAPIQQAAATAANTASEPLTGGPSAAEGPDPDRGHGPGRQDAEGAHGEVADLPVLVDGDALGPDPADGLVGGADAVGTKHHLVEHLAGVHLHLDGTCPPGSEPSARCRRAPPPRPASSGPAPDRTGDRRARAPATGGRGLGPHRSTQVEGDRRPGQGHPLDHEPGGHRGHLGQDLGPFRRGPLRSPVTPTRRTPVPSASMPTATGGRFGPDRTTSSRDQSTRTGRPCSSARPAGVGAPPASAACRRRPHRWRRARPARPRGGTRRHPARRSPAPPRWSAG